MSERLYEPLNGAETRQWLELLIEELRTTLDSHPLLSQHITWPRATAELELVLHSPDAQPVIKVLVSRGPVTAPDNAREALGLGVPVAIQSREGKREVRTSAKTAKTAGKLTQESD